MELFFNGTSLGRQRIDHAHGLKPFGQWQLEYHKGEITALAFDDEGNNDIRAVGGMVLQYWSKVIIQLERGEETNQRIATLKRHRSIGEGRQAVFRITSRGIS